MIKGVRLHIEELWNSLSMSSEERLLFSDFFSEEYNDELLDSHQNYARRLDIRYDNSKSILAMIARRTTLRNQQNELDNQISDPKRLLAKRSSTNLLQEEKMRNSIARELPLLEKNL